MADEFASLKTILSNDATLATLLQGGVFDDEDTGADGVTQSFAETNGMIDDATGALSAFCFIAWSTTTPQELNHADAYGADRFFTVYIYDDNSNGYGTVERALKRIIDLLNYTSRTVTDGSGVFSHVSRWVDSSPRLRADELFDAALISVRFIDTFGR